MLHVILLTEHAICASKSIESTFSKGGQTLKSMIAKLLEQQYNKLRETFGRVFTLL